jgi:hypothetical protein
MLIRFVAPIFGSLWNPFIFITILLFFAIPICTIRECKKEVLDESKDTKKTKNY